MKDRAKKLAGNIGGVVDNSWKNDKGTSVECEILGEWVLEPVLHQRCDIWERALVAYRSKTMLRNVRSPLADVHTGNKVREKLESGETAEGLRHQLKGSN